MPIGGERPMSHAIAPDAPPPPDRAGAALAGEVGGHAPSGIALP